MYYVQFYNNHPHRKPSFIKGNTWYVEALGSDSVFILDGRNRLDIMKTDAVERANRLKNVQKYAAYRIFRGDRFDNDNPLTGIIPL